MLKAKNFINLFTSLNLFIAAVLLALTAFAYSYPKILAEDVRENIQVEMTKEMDCLAKNVYYEAASESFEGKLAVAQVTINRTNSSKYPKTICGVVYQRDKVNGKTICQFSWTCEKTQILKNRYLWEEAQYISRKALTEPILHAKIAANNVMYFHATYVNPGWKKTGFVMKIGNHIFYTRT